MAALDDFEGFGLHHVFGLRCYPNLAYMGAKCNFSNLTDADCYYHKFHYLFFFIGSTQEKVTLGLKQRKQNYKKKRIMQF